MLSIIVFFPLVVAAVVACVPENKAKLIRVASLAGTFLHFALSLLILSRFDNTTPNLQLAEQHAWIPELGISYFLGIDGISLWLVLLTTFLGPLVVLSSWTGIAERVKAFHIAMLALQTAMIGSFLAMDAILFYTFFELALVPMYFMIGIWGGTRRIYATLKFFIYTMVGSLLMLAAIIYLMFTARDTLGQMTSNMVVLYQLKLPFVAGTLLNAQTLLFWAFALAFAIKVPMWPVHTWLPDAHVEAPTPGSVILAAVMLKMGTYGFLRFAMPLFPEAAEYFSGVFLILGLIGIIYGALVAMVQPDIKKLVAYSSVSHMGYVVIGMFAMNEFGVGGAIYQMLNHGISTGALFFLVGMVYERTHSREIKRYGGLAKAMPIFTIAFIIITMSSIAVPMTNGFIGEFLILLGTFQSKKVLAVFAVTGVILGAAYMLWMVKRVFFGPEGELVADKKHPLHDLSPREIAVLVPMIVMVFWMGLFPNFFLDRMRPSVSHWVLNRDAYNLNVTAAANQNPPSIFDRSTEVSKAMPKDVK